MKRNKFSLSHYKLFTASMGELIPITWYEVLPGDTVQQYTATLVRCAPMVAPVMHPTRVRIHHWFVPLRLIWEDFEDFITGGEDGLDASVWPHRIVSSVSEGDLEDYLGVPTGSYPSPNLTYSALPERAYAAIYNHWYRDQQLCSEVAMSTASGQDTTTGSSLQLVAWEKDYFTTMRPEQQLGAEVTIGFDDDIRVYGIGKVGQSYTSGPTSVYETDGTTTRNYANYHAANLDSTLRIEEDPSNAGYPNVRAATSELTMGLDQLREALAIQKYQEARNLYGARYVEYLRYLGVRSSDARLNNPEYLGGGRQIIQFSEVLDHGSTNANVGDMKGHGISAMRTPRFRRFFEEHGIVMSLMSVVPKAMYLESLWKGFSRYTKEDYFQKELQFVGDQAVLYQEVNAGQTAYLDTMGYQARYDNYRWHPSTVAGEFRSTLDHWHMTRSFAGDIALNNTFIEANPTKRCFADTESDTLYCMANHSIQSRRLLAKRGTTRTL